MRYLARLQLEHIVQLWDTSTDSAIDPPKVILEIMCRDPVFFGLLHAFDGMAVCCASLILAPCNFDCS